MKIGSTVTLVYTGTLEDGTVFGYAKPENPMTFQTGMGMVIDGFEKAILQMEKAGEKKSFVLEDYEGYGEYLEWRMAKISLEQIPAGRAEIGKRTWLASDEDGSPLLATCIDVSDGFATFDLNHPLAGQRLAYEVELLAVEDAPEGFVPEAVKERERLKQMSAFG